MGVKSTVKLTRDAAEQRYVALYLKDRAQRREAKVRLKLEHLRHQGGFDMPGLSDEEIRDAYVYVDALQRSPRNRKKVVNALHSLTDQQLEDKLEKLNDRVHDGEGFENYIICAGYLIDEED